MHTDRQNGENGIASTEEISATGKPCQVGKNQFANTSVVRSGKNPVRKLGWHSVYEHVGRRKLGHDPHRHGRSTIIVYRK